MPASTRVPGLSTALQTVRVQNPADCHGHIHDPRMSEFKFACPACSQHIAGDERWAGLQIKCPACQADMMVPQLEAPPAPAPAPSQLSFATATVPSGQAAPTSPAPTPISPAPASTPVRLTLSAARAPAAPAAPTPPAPVPPRPGAGPAPKPYTPSYLQPEQKGGKARTILTVAIIVVVLGVAAFAVAPLINSAQNKMNEKRKKDSEDFGGGEVGHAMELNRVLDATDPARFERGAGSKEPQLTAPPWSLDVAAAAVPSGTVRGKVSNFGFILDDASLEVTGGAYVLSLRQGLNIIPDREVLISLRLNAGENIQGKSWTITKDMTTGAPGIAKKWRTDFSAPPKQAAFTGGYALKLEFEKAVTGIIPGKIYLALPDQEQSVIAGEFRADIRVPSAPGSKPARPMRSRFGDE
jgi:hypothetical protein